VARVAEQLVGRAAELRELDAAVAGLGRAGPAALLLLGEPGIGKSRMLGELAARADTSGCIVLSGSGSELELDLPYSVFVDALDEYVAGLDPRRLESLDDSVRAELARFLPSLSDYGGGGEAPLRDERYRTHRAVRELLERLAATKPLVLVLDDVHWADSASIDLLAALLRRPAGATTLLALAARPRQLPERLAGAVERASRTDSLTRLELTALTRNEAGQLLGEAVEPALADTVYEESGGNPFYLEQLARSVDRTGGVEARGADVTLTGVDVPPAVAAALTEELALLSSDTRRLLEGAAVAGDPFEPELAAAAAAFGEAAAMEALDELLAFDLVRRTDVPRRFRFRHPLVRRAVHETAPGGWLLGGMSAARRRSPSAALPRRRVHTTSSTRRARATPPRWQSCGRPARRSCFARPRARRHGSAPPCACFPTAPRASSASGS
jgi:predicted ATPase